MNTLGLLSVIKAPMPWEEQDASSATELLLGLALGACTLAAVRVAGYAVLGIPQLHKQFFEPS